MPLAQETVSVRRDDGTCTMERLREKETARGEGANVPLRGDRRLIATQKRTGCMTKRGLRILLFMYILGTIQCRYSSDDTKQTNIPSCKDLKFDLEAADSKSQRYNIPIMFHSVQSLILNFAYKLTLKIYVLVDEQI
jgi:hypothetical protein